MKANNNRTKAQRDADLVIVSDMLIKGYTATAIAERIKSIRNYSISAKTAANDCNYIRELWREQATSVLSDAIQHELMLLRYVQVEAVEAWERGKQNGPQPVQTPQNPRSKRAKDQANRLRAINRTRGQAPLFDSSSEYLHVILRVSERRAKLLGLDKPTKSEHGGPDGGPIPLLAGPMVLEVAVVDETSKHGQTPKVPA